MKIIKLSKKEAKYTTFHLFIEFEVYDDQWAESEDDQFKEITEVCKWCGETFTRNYIIIENSQQIIGGGNVNNRKYWNSRIEEDNKPRITGNYQLRCSNEDSIIFLLKYQEKG